MYVPGGQRTSLSLEARKSAASLDELRGVLSLAVCKSSVWVLEARVFEFRSIQMRSLRQFSRPELLQRDFSSVH